MTLPIHLAHEGGGFVRDFRVSASDIHNLTGDEIQNFANPVFPMPSHSEHCEASSTPAHVTTQRYLDRTTDRDLLRAVTPGIKKILDHVIFDIGMFMNYQDRVIPATECVWHPFSEVLTFGSAF